MNEVSELLKIDINQMKRPIGEVEMLIGFEYAGFHPQKINNNRTSSIVKEQIW